MAETTRIRDRDRTTILNALRAGVVPVTGLEHLLVGRRCEIEALQRDLETLADGGSTLRFFIGPNGSGKTFMLRLVCNVALRKGFVTSCVDLHPALRLHATKGQARALYRELMAKLATRVRPRGALPAVVERFVNEARKDAREQGEDPEALIHQRLGQLTELSGGYDFAEVIASYCRAFDTGDETLGSNAIRWLRAEYSTRTEARRALGVRTIIDDATLYDHLKLFARFVRLAGYRGLLIGLDEIANLYRLHNTQARNSNYEQILRILNDILSGASEGLGFVMGATPEVLRHPSKGFYSYEALKSRLPEDDFAIGGRVNYQGPILRLANLTPEDLQVLLENIRHVYAGGDRDDYLVPDEALSAFMADSEQRLGSDHYSSPRDSVRRFVSFLDNLVDNPETSWRELLERDPSGWESEYPDELPSVEL